MCLSFLSTYMMKYLPNRELLSFRTVFELPKLSITGLQFNILTSTGTSPSFGPPSSFSNSEVMKPMHNLVPKVLPAPDSPEMHMACFLLLSNSCQKALDEMFQM